MSEPNATSPPAGPAGLLLCDDMLFTSRVTGVARALGVAVRPVRSSADLEAAAGRECPRCVILDLGNMGLDVPGLLTRLRTACAVMPTVVAFGSHVDAGTLRQARDAGCDVVLPRSKFVESLPTALPEWLAGRPG